MTKIIIKMALMRAEGKTIYDLIATLEEAAEMDEIRLKIKEEDFREYGQNVIDGLTARARSNGWNIAPDNHEGIRVSFDKDNGDGWFLLRLSVHDPIIPINIESNTHGGVEVIAKKLYGAIKNYSGLDFSGYAKYIG